MKTLLTIICLIFFGLALRTTTFAQDYLGCNGLSKVKRNGWRVPGLSEFNVVSEVSKWKVEGSEVTEKVYKRAKPNKPPLQFDCKIVIYRNYGNRRTKMRVCSEVTALTSYEVNGLVFAYYLEIVSSGSNITTGEHSGAKGVGRYYLADEDGDGELETRYSPPLGEESYPSCVLRKRINQ